MNRFILTVLTVVATCRGGPAEASLIDAVGREFSTYSEVDSVIPVNTAAGREFTLLNAPPSVIPANTAVGRELTLHNSPPATIPVNVAVGRELTLFNTPASVIPVNSAVGPEFTMNNDPAVLIPANAAVGREFTGYLLPYTLVEVAEALRIAAGLNAGTADSVLRLNVAIVPPSATIVDVLDAARVAYLQTIAPPAE